MSSPSGRPGPPTATFVALSAGAEFTCGLRADGGVTCWGANDWGQSAPPPARFTAIAAGAFHVAKPADLIPELQGRFPIRVELDPLTREDFVRILTEPQNALIRQYVELLRTEGVTLRFTEDAVEAIADIASTVNQRAENIGARRLYTVMERLLEDVSFDAPTMAGRELAIDAEYVQAHLAYVVKDEDLSRYIL